MIYDVWIALALVILACVKRLFYKGPLLCFIALIDFSFILILYYSSLRGFDFYLINITKQTFIGVLILLYCLRDIKNLNLYLTFVILIAATAFLDTLKLFGIIDNTPYLYVGRFSTIIEVILIYVGFWNVRGTGFLNNIKTNHAFFHTWSRYLSHFKINEDRKIEKNDIRRTKP